MVIHGQLINVTKMGIKSLCKLNNGNEALLTICDQEKIEMKAEIPIIIIIFNNNSNSVSNGNANRNWAKD